MVGEWSQRAAFPAPSFTIGLPRPWKCLQLPEFLNDATCGMDVSRSFQSLLQIDVEAALGPASDVPALIQRTLLWWEGLSQDLLAQGDDLQRKAGHEVPPPVQQPVLVLPEAPLGPIGPNGLRGPAPGQEPAPGPGAHVPPHLQHLGALPGRTRSHAGSVWGGSASGESAYPMPPAPPGAAADDELEGAHGGFHFDCFYNLYLRFYHVFCRSKQTGVVVCLKAAMCFSVN